MFISDEVKYSIPVRSIAANGAVDKINLRSDDEVRDFLGDVPSQGGSTLNTAGSLNYRKDEKCRFIHLCTPSTVGPLELHPRMLLRLMTFYQVMTQFLDFLYVFSTVSQGFMSSLEVHLDFAEWAASEWRWHILFLEDRAEELTKPARIRERSHLETIKPASLTDVQKWEEKTNDTIMAMESNVNIMRLLQRFYRDLLKDENFPGKERLLCQQGAKTFSFRLEELICETQMQIMRAKALAKLVADRKTIIIQHLQAQSAIISSRLAASMFEQADRSAMEAIAVRIVTIVTMIYLPATFSSTFFSTDVVKYQQGEVFSKVALLRFIEVTLPLMMLTFVPAGVWFWIELRKRTQKSHKIKRSMSELFPPDAANI
ncbi:hypothetical protein CGCSCA5_v003335 [Colletotrichum siamense]|nr:hypothetical protein CGCSCA5_v003335 [Colletotrichum siamense]